MLDPLCCFGAGCETASRAVSAFSGAASPKHPVTYVYVDAFNLFYGCVKGTSHRWLDLSRVCRLLLPRHDVRAIKYFTALVKPRSGNPNQRLRQETYIRALCTLPEFTIYYGHFLSNPVMMPLARPGRTGPRYAHVTRTQEKGSDVNLATQLLCDAFDDSYEVAVIVSNDSDLLGPAAIVKEKFGKTVGVLNPHKTGGGVFAGTVDFVKRIRRGVLAGSQFPDRLVDERGPIRKPIGW